MGSSDDNITSSNSAAVKKSFDASEIVVQSARGNISRAGVIDYGSKDIVSEMGPDFAKKLAENQASTLLKQSDGTT